MKTKIIPFDLETVKKIQAGEIKGKVYFKTKLADVADGSGTYIFNLKALYGINNSESSYYGLFECNGEEYIQYIKSNGYIPEQLVTLIIEVLDNEPQFKPFDKVLVRYPDKTESCASKDRWIPGIFQYKSVNSDLYLVSGKAYKDCIPYEGNEYLVGTTDKPKED